MFAQEIFHSSWFQAAKYETWSSHDKKNLYSGAWNAAVWAQLFPMSLADRSFNSDGNCVYVIVCVWEKIVKKKNGKGYAWKNVRRLLLVSLRSWQ